MATNLQTSSDPSVPSLLSGIVHDFQELIKQQVELFKTEVKADIRKSKEAAASLALGLCFLLLGSILLCLTLVYLLHELAALPMWASYLIVTAAVALPGGFLAYTGWKKFHSFNPLPDESAQALKETLEWTTKPK
jgi:hypothetical protein